MVPDSTPPAPVLDVTLAAPAVPDSSLANEEVVMSEEPVDKKPACLLDSLLINQDCQITQVEEARCPYERCSSEVASYRAEPKLPNDARPLDWWKLNSFRFPFLSMLATALLSVPATSVPTERVFSTAGDTVTQQRASLKPKHVDRLTFLKKNWD